MVQQKTLFNRIVVLSIYGGLTIMAILCILPLVNVLALSFSSTGAIQANKVTLWPVEFTWQSYQFVAQKRDFIASIWVSVQRVGLGIIVNMVLTVLVAYPLSKEVSQFRFRTWYVWIFVFTMLFSGGLVPSYIVVKELGLLDTMWALVLPGAVPIFNVILMLNFFRALPKELMEAAFMDGAGHWKLLWRIIVPLSLPSIATVGLFTIVGHWNEWFQGIIYMNDPSNYPLASYLQTVVIKLDLSKIRDVDDALRMMKLDNRAVRAAQIFVGSLPIFLVYPFLQRFFMTGIVMGSIKE
ncbi:carbohydrate ABC transporter permease [Paenibacillaceae bacterium]|nr:carbohydrate ABC transporter permease [Paenibacillaceae bacterium]